MSHELTRCKAIGCSGRGVGGLCDGCKLEAAIRTFRQVSARLQLGELTSEETIGLVNDALNNLKQPDGGIMSNQLAHGELFKNLYKREASGLTPKQREDKLWKIHNALGHIENAARNLKHQASALARLKKLLKLQLEELQ